jgi:hypothetical protein
MRAKAAEGAMLFRPTFADDPKATVMAGRFGRNHYTYFHLGFLSRKKKGY